MTTDEGDATDTTQEIDALEKKLRDKRLLGDADDPLFFLGIIAVALVTAFALAATLPFGFRTGHELRDVILKSAGGVLVILGAYTAVRTIISNRANGASQTFASILALLASDERTEDAARVGAIRHLPDLARRRGADPAAIDAVIEQLLSSEPADDALRIAAEDARRDFPAKSEQRAPDHRRRTSASRR
jgi:hypothetical protein